MYAHTYLFTRHASLLRGKQEFLNIPLGRRPLPTNAYDVMSCERQVGRERAREMWGNDDVSLSLYICLQCKMMLG